jgi:glycosyltransferase involved in cell wall biosynthesis
MTASNGRTAGPASQASADGARRLRVRLLHTRYPQMGAHAGMVQLPRAFDRTLVDAQICAVTDGDDDFPIRAETVRAWLRPRLKRGGMAWYKLSDLHAELGALGAVARGAVDIVHFLDGEHSAQLVPRIVRRIAPRRSRTVATFHQPPATLGTLIDRRVVEALDLVTVVSPTQVDWFAKAVPHVRTELVLHGVDAAFFSPAPAPRSPDGRFRCVTVGHWLRDWAAMRGAIERLGTAGGMEFCIVTTRDTGVEGMAGVVIHRELSDEALRALYRSADVLLLPLIDATANNALMEGMACGLPVLTTEHPSLRAYVPSDAGIFVERNDPDAIAGAVEWLRSDEASRAALGARARARAEALAWPRIAGQMTGLYHEIVA